ncbi:MAG: tail fiber domain-containing protein [Rhodothermales bacterium]
MKTHWNMRKLFNIIPHTLLLLCCVVLLSSLPAKAASSTSMTFFMQQKPNPTEDENGRSSADRNRRGAATNNDFTPPPTDVWKGCDYDVCSGKGQAAQRMQNEAITGSPDFAQNVGMLSFKIQPGAPANSVFVADGGDIGIGTQTPLGRLHVVAEPGEEGAGDIFLLDASGNLEIGGLLTEASSALLKENFVPVEGLDVLNRLATLPISTWNYKTDDATIRHMGPMAQDFYAAFGLGKDDRHIAPLDANGVALAALQAMHAQGQAQAARIALLERQNADLLQRLHALEALVHQRDE